MHRRRHRGLLRAPIRRPRRIPRHLPMSRLEFGCGPVAALRTLRWVRAVISALLYDPYRTNRERSRYAAGRCLSPLTA